MPNYGNSNLKISDAITVAEVSGTPDSYPTHFAFLGKGGWRSAATLSALNSTSAARKEQGCAGYVWNDGGNNGLYVWDGSTWVKTSLSPTGYTLPIAAASTLGGVRIPASGPISINNSNGDLSLRVATTSATGIVRVGSGLAIDGDGILSVTSANLTVINENGSYSQSYPKLRFKGTAIAGIAEDAPNSENQVTINLPTATVDTEVGAFSNIVFAAGGGMSVAGNYNSGTKTYTVTYNVTASGTLKQNLHELTDVNQSTVQTPNNGQILQFTGSKWNAVNYTPGIALTSLSASAPIIYNNGAFTMNVATTSQDGYLTSTNWNTFNGKQNAITLTTTGTSGAATFNATTGALNIPQYSGGGGGGTVTSVAALTIGTTGTDITSTVANGSTTPVITLHIPTASTLNRGVITKDQHDTFNTVTNKLNITAATNAGSGASITLDFANADTIYGSVASPVTASTIGVNTTSAKVGVTHIVVHNSSTAPTISGALKLSGSGNYKVSVNNYIYFTYISGTTVICSINQAYNL
jgi:hypothetical protein